MSLAIRFGEIVHVNLAIGATHTRRREHTILACPKDFLKYAVQVYEIPRKKVYKYAFDHFGIDMGTILAGHYANYLIEEGLKKYVSRPHATTIIPELKDWVMGRSHNNNWQD